MAATDRTPRISVPVPAALRLLRSRLTRATRAMVVLVLVLVLDPLTAGRAHADEASGTWTGRIETRGSYYWERSTRVVAPTIGARVESPRGVAIQGYYLVDSITSASVAAGALVDTGFTEIRHEASVGVGGEIDVGEQHLAITGALRYSHEPDYDSYSGNLAARLALDDRNTIVGASITFLHDEVGQVFRTGNQVRPPNMGAPFDRQFQGFTSSLYVEQVLNARSLVVAGYDLSRLTGYLASPYRQVQVGGVLAPESHPDERVRHTLWARYQLALPEAHGALHAIVRGYADSWDVRAVSVEGRWYQELGAYSMVRLRYRYYTQSASFFDSGATVPTYVSGTRYFTADGKMQRFHDHEAGFALITKLGFLAESGLGWLERAEIELACDYRVSTNRFGNAVVGALVVRMPID